MRRPAKYRPVHRAGRRHYDARLQYGRHMLLTLDDWDAWLPGRERQLSTYGYVPRHARPEEDE